MPKTIAEAKVVGQRLLNSSTKLIDVYAPDIANQAVPGQFVNVQVCKNTAPLLRRPFGVAGVNKEQGTFTMIYRIIGEGTHILADVCAGDVLSIVGPLGHGFDIQGVFSERNIVRVKLAKEQQRGYPILPIVKVIDDFDFELLEYMFAVHNRFQSDLRRLGYDGAAREQELDSRDMERIRLHRDVHRLKAEDRNISEIAKLKGISRNTVKRYLQLNTREFSKFLVEINRNPQEYQSDILELLYADHRISTKRIL